MIDHLKDYENRELDDNYSNILNYVDRLRRKLFLIEKQLCQYVVYEDADYSEADL